MRGKKRLSVLVILAVMVAMLALPMSAYAAVKINKTKATIDVGKTVTLKITGAAKGAKVKWASSKKSVATVSSKGVVEGVKAGTAKITATVSNKKYTCTVKVKEPSSKVTEKKVVFEPLKKNALPLEVGKTLKLVARCQDDITWKSSDKSVATVDENGVVTAVKEGYTIIVAASESDPTIRNTMRVDVINGITIDKDNYAKHLSFSIREIPCLKYYEGVCRKDPADGKVKYGEWENTGYDAEGNPVWKYKNPIKDLYDIDLNYYLVLDPAGISNLDLDRTQFEGRLSYLRAFKKVIWTIDPKTIDVNNWTNPTFDVNHTKTRRPGFTSEEFENYWFENGILRNDSGEPIDDLEDHIGGTVLEYVYPTAIASAPIYGIYLDDADINYYRNNKQNIALKDWKVSNLVDAASLRIYKIDGELIRK